MEVGYGNELFTAREDFEISVGKGDENGEQVKQEKEPLPQRSGF